jgi:hypothetical protein
MLQEKVVQYFVIYDGVVTIEREVFCEQCHAKLEIYLGQ